MSWSVIIQCDYRLCPNECRRDHAGRRLFTMTDARVAASNAGWSFVIDATSVIERDYCPDHSDDPREHP